MKKQQVLLDDHFDLKKLNKYGTLMTLGNGYMGIRGVHEEAYPEQKRGTYVAGIYNKMFEGEPDEIVNLPDLIGMKIEINGEAFSLMKGEIHSYSRQLHLVSGELTRNIVWENEAGVKLALHFQRLVAKHDLHVFASKVTVQCLNRDVNMKIVTGIDGQQTNFGRQHLIEKSLRVYDELYLHGLYETSKAEHSIALFSACKHSKVDNIDFISKNRQLLATSSVSLKQNETYTMEKYGVIYTSLDNDLAEDSSLEEIGLKKIREVSHVGYEQIAKQSTKHWKQFWDKNRVVIASEQEMDQLAIDFAIYHIDIMTPKHNNKFSVAAKGLTGEGYKGHVFWDTEIFILPFYLYTNPTIAKQLLQYRYDRIPQAMKKAKANGYEGAQFPWESALTGEEETPTYAAINIKTGKRQKVASAMAEHHIVADIAFAVIQYYETTRDKEFMKNEGITLLEETSKFWISRATEEEGTLSIKNVIGPDEYTEFIDNNAYTNYMAYYNVEQALNYLKEFQVINKELQIAGENFLEKLYLPKENDEKIIPQDDTFLTKPTINLEKYKKMQGSQSILLDYSRAEVNEMQILKQADVVMLLYLFPELFEKDTILKNFKYYEDRTIHDSSLSKAIHAIVAMRCNEKDLAYTLFQEACLIDLGPNPHSSDEGIHAASLGSIWLSVFSFLNVSFGDEEITLNPTIPDTWTSVTFPLHYRGRSIKITVDKERIVINKSEGESIKFQINGEYYQVEDQLQIDIA
ncbi:glycoside hydrolase family 65 protein [Gracilibacillus sp. HCP3S3_G5_1]|uniref:glycoside hydrolase family 65 protein n=1 Tax=unclassified Gracilibacillus TaxID=2625209 RepID=UPI003F89FBE4